MTARAEGAMKPLAGRPRPARVVVAVVDSRPTVDQKDGVSSVTVELTGVRAAAVDDSGAVTGRYADACGRPDSFWEFALADAKRVQVWFTDHDEALSLLWPPAGWRHRPLNRTPSGDPCPVPDDRAGGVRVTILTLEPEDHAGVWPARWGARRELEILQLGNIHPDGIAASELKLHQAVEHIAAWTRLINKHDLGPRLDYSLACQTKRAWLRSIHPGRPQPDWTDDDWQRIIRWHIHDHVTDLERDAIAANKPPRMHIDAGSEHHNEMWSVDFNSQYASVMAAGRLPRQLVAYAPRHPTPGRIRVPFTPAAALEEHRSGRRLMIARLEDGQVLLDDDLHDIHARDVDEYALYDLLDPGTFKRWAETLYAARESAETPAVAGCVKVMLANLWGKLSQSNYNWRPVDEIDRSAAAAHRGRIVYDESALGVDRWWDDGRGGEPGRLWERDRGLPVENRACALAAHVLHRARRQTLDWERGIEAAAPGSVRYIHTDSIWSTTPPAGEARSGLGGWKLAHHQRVELLAGGGRIVDGVLDAQTPGGGDRRQRHWAPTAGRGVAVCSEYRLYSEIMPREGHIMMV